jgi:hypothetical protein
MYQNALECNWWAGIIVFSLIFVYLFRRVCRRFVACESSAQDGWAVLVFVLDSFTSSSDLYLERDQMCGH